MPEWSMKTIQNALSTWQQGGSPDPVPQKWVARIFERLTAQLGAKVSDLYAGVPAENVQAEWANALAGFHPSEIDRGLRACATRPFAPTLGEFTRLCRPSLDPEVAFIEAAHCLMQRDLGEIGGWSHPAIYRAASKMNLEVRAGIYREVRKRWEVTLMREFEEGWSEIPVPLTRITAQPAPARPPSAKEREKLAQMRELLTAGFNTEEIRLGMTDVERT
jgi:hypothetical protein